MYFHPIFGSALGGRPGAVLLLLHGRVEPLAVQFVAALPEDERGQVDGEPKGVVQFKGPAAIHGFPPGFGDYGIQARQPLFQGLQEGNFFFPYHVFDQPALFGQLREGLPHLRHQGTHQAEHKRLPGTQEGKPVADGAAEDPTDHIAGTRVAWKLAVCDGKRYGPDMVGNDADGNIVLLRLAVILAGDLSDLPDQRGKQVRIVIGPNPLQDHAQPFKAHARVDVLLRKGLQAAVRLSVILNKNQVPDLHHLGVVLVDQFGPGGFPAFFFRADIDVDLRTGAAGPLVAHFPEIVFFGPHQDPVFRQDGLPKVIGLLVALQGVRIGTSLKNGHIEPVPVDPADFRQEFPGPPDGFLLEIIAETPVAEHLKQCVVVGVPAHLFQVVVFAAYPEALLGVGHAGVFRDAHPQEILLEGVHPGVDKQQGGIVFDHQGGRRHDPVSAVFEKC